MILGVRRIENIERPMFMVTKIEVKQVDILISKNQALQILYLKHCIYKTT